MNKTILLLIVSALLMSASAVQALDFSADVVTTAGGQRMAGKIYVANDKVRMDIAGASTIARMDKQVSWVLMPQQSLYMEQPIDPERVAGATEKMPGEVERVALGPDTLDGRAVSKYRVTYASREGRATMIQWVDNDTSIPIKSAAENGSWTMEYRNLQTGAQDPSIFEIPAGYKKFAMPNMNDMMRAAGRQVQQQMGDE